MHGGSVFGVAHGGVDDQRDKDHAAEVIIEPVFVPKALEVQRNRRRSAAEQRNRDGIGQADAERTHFGGKQLGLHDGVDRGIAGDENPRRADQQEGRRGRFGLFQRGQDWDGRQRAGDAEEDQQRLAADAVRERAVQRLQDGGEDQRTENHQRGLVFGQPDREFDEGLHIGGEGVERGGAAGGQSHHEQQLARIV